MLYVEANYLGNVCYRLSSCSSEYNHYANRQVLARDLRPISTVDGKGFQQLLHFTELGYKIPSCLYLTATCRRTPYKCLQCNLNLPSFSWDVLLLCLYTLIVFDAMHFTCSKVADATVCTSELQTY